MKIYTGSGDKGDTSLYGGTTIRKDHPKVAVYGSLDELNSMLGIVCVKVSEAAIVSELQRVQNEIFDLSAEVAADERGVGMLENKISNEHYERLEKTMDRWNEQLEPLKKFILPGGSESATFAHVARTICRRAERELTALASIEQVRPDCLVYLNRLSDWIFVLARLLNKLNGKDDVFWNG